MDIRLKVAFALCAAALLLGSAGMYAVWSDETDDDRGDEISSGPLRFSDTLPGEWADASTGTVVAIDDIDDFVVIPGDVLTYTLSSTVRAEGDRVATTLEADPSSITDEPRLLEDVDLTTEMAVGGRPRSVITEADNGETLDVTVTLAFGPASLSAGTLSGRDLSGLMLTMRHDAP